MSMTTSEEMREIQSHPMEDFFVLLSPLKHFPKLTLSLVTHYMSCMCALETPEELSRGTEKGIQL